MGFKTIKLILLNWCHMESLVNTGPDTLSFPISLKIAAPTACIQDNLKDLFRAIIFPFIDGKCFMAGAPVEDFSSTPVEGASRSEDLSPFKIANK